MTGSADKVPVLELRVLSGCHEGARAPMAEGRLRVGVDDDCDVILTDLVLMGEKGEYVWLYVQEGRWSVRGLPADDETPASTAQRILVPASSLGTVAMLGGVALTVSDANAPWQKVPMALMSEDGSARPENTVEPVLLDMTDEEKPDGVQSALTAGSDDVTRVRDVAMEEKTPVPRARRWGLLVAGIPALAVLIVAVGWGLATRGVSSGAAMEARAAAPRPDAAAQQRMRQEIAQALAAVDPGLRLQVTLLPAGNARISGWVSDNQQLDRLAEGLARIQPQPELAVSTASDLLDDLREINSSGSNAAPLRFELLGAGRVQVNGVVLTADEQRNAMAYLRDRAPQGIELVDGLRVAASQGSALQNWLKQQGFPGVRANWNGSRMELAVNASVEQMPRLEALLIRNDTPLFGIPYALRVHQSAPPGSKDAAPAGVYADVAPLPFRIRSVIGGGEPYVVLSDGSKLLPGAQRSGWKLVSIQSDRMLFDGPRQLVVLR